MIYSLWTENTDIPLAAIAFAASFLLTAAAVVIFRGFLPKDQGREFAVNGALSQGKPRGAGIILISVFVVCCAFFTKMSAENIIDLALIFAAMLTGYLDDAAKMPWGELKKGLLDLVISAAISINFVYHNDTEIGFFGTTLDLPKAVYAVLGIVLVWASINVVNCTDGVDGLCASLSMVSVFLFIGLGANYFSGVVMLGVLAAYLWFNCHPSRLLMGDAGSRSIGVFIALMAMRSGRPLLFIPFVLVMIIDGGLGLVKLTIIRVTHKQDFMSSIRTPIHDHTRKNKDWSDTQVVARFVILQLVLGFTVKMLL